MSTVVTAPDLPRTALLYAMRPMICHTRQGREFLDEKSKQHREHTIISIGWRLGPAIFAHICRGVSLERAITGNANISGPFTYR